MMGLAESISNNKNTKRFLFGISLGSTKIEILFGIEDNNS